MMSKYEKNTAPDVKWQDITLAADVFEGGTAAAIETGDWRTIKPVIDWDKCKQCLLCFLRGMCHLAVYPCKAHTCKSIDIVTYQIEFHFKAPSECVGVTLQPG